MHLLFCLLGFSCVIAGSVQASTHQHANDFMDAGEFKKAKVVYKQLARQGDIDDLYKL